MKASALRTIVNLSLLSVCFGVVIYSAPPASLAVTGESIAMVGIMTAITFCITWLIGACILAWLPFLSIKVEREERETCRAIAGYFGDLTWSVIGKDGTLSAQRYPYVDYVVGEVSQVVYVETYRRRRVGKDLLSKLLYGDNTEWEYDRGGASRIELIESAYDEIVNNL